MPALLFATRSDIDEPHEWSGVQKIPTQSWTCGFCGREVASDSGWAMTRHTARGGQVVVGAVAICPRCNLPSLLADGYQMPLAPLSNDVEHLPEGIRELYEESRRALNASAPTATVMAGRKLLMAVAVERGAPENKNFATYVQWLVDNGIVMPTMRDLVDEIREMGNEANHEIRLVTMERAAELLTYVEMLLRVAYEFPERGRIARQARDQSA